MENGTILVYKPTDVNFCMILNPANTEKATCLDVSEDSSRLLAGYSKGSVCLFDLTNGRLLRKDRLCGGNTSPLIFVKIPRISTNKTILYLGNAEDRVYRVKLIEKKGISLKIGQENIDIQPLNFYFSLKNVINGYPVSIPLENDRKAELCAVAMAQRVLVIDLKNRKEAAFELQRPAFIDQGQPPIIYWDNYRYKNSYCFREKA